MGCRVCQRCLGGLAGTVGTQGLEGYREHWETSLGFRGHFGDVRGHQRV